MIMKNNNFFLDLNINIVVVNGEPIIQFRKQISVKNNLDFFVKILKASFIDENALVTVPVSIKFKDKLKALNKLREIGVIIDFNELRKVGKREN